MELTLFVKKGRKEVINRVELDDVAARIKDELAREHVRQLRMHYHLMKPRRQEDGSIVTRMNEGINLPRLCFAALFENRKGERRMLRYNGLVILEVNDLPNYEAAVAVREQAKRMPETLLCFLGASGKSVKIVVRGELFGEGGLPEGEEAIKMFHSNVYKTARTAYQNQFAMGIAYLEPRLDRTVYLSADPEAYYNPNAKAFLADTEEYKQVEPVIISDADDYLMPGRTITRTYQLNWLFIVNNVLKKVTAPVNT